MSDTMTQIEVNGVKMEVDMRYAKRIEELRVGSKVRVMTKDYSGHTVHSGVIIGFEPFTDLPTIIVCYLEKSYSKMELKFLHFNAESKDIGLVKAVDDDLDMEKSEVFDWFDREQKKLRDQIDELETRKQYFANNFAVYWETIKKEDLAIV